jgi:hypothetical protein
MLSSTLTHLQKTMQTKIYQLGQMLPVLPHSKLLAASRHQTLVLEVQQLSALPESHFKALYRPAINRYAEFVQVISEEPLGSLGGLLNLGLARGLLALRQYAATEAKLDADPLINYAVFTAGLFFDVVKVISQQKIVLCDITGKYLQDWYPYSGSMVEQQAEFYKLYPYNTTVYEGLNHAAVGMLARQLMPQEGFLWLSSDLDILIDWLDALRGEHQEGGRKISHLLSLIPQQDILALLKNLPQAAVDLVTPQEMQLDDKFYIWLREGLANGTIGINTNEANVHVLDDGTLYLNNEVFKTFLDTNKITADANKVMESFNERFGVESQVAPGKIEYATFLMQRTQKNLQVRNGMFAMGALFLIDMIYVGSHLSPLQKDIKSTLQTARSLPQQLPSVKQTLAAERRPNSGPNFKMK